MSECAICFEKIEQHGVRCTDSNCVTLICKECVHQYVNVVASDNSKLACPRTGCVGEYDEKSLKNQSEECKKTYRKYIIKHFLITHGETVSKLIAKTTTLEKLKEERTRFYAEKMPKAVKKVAEIVFKSRLTKVKNAEKEIAKDNSTKYTRKCFNIFCNGFLSEDLTCSKCFSLFCKICECAKTDQHECDPRVVENVKYIQSLTICPKCKTPIEKGEGCMAITCAVCFTNFWYNSGEESHVGNHGQSIHVDIDVDKISMSSTHSGLFLELGILEHIKELEKEYRKRPLVKLDRLMVSISNGTIPEDDRSRLNFSKLYSEFARHAVNNVYIGKKLGMIENLIVTKPDGWEIKLKLLGTDRPVTISKISKKNGFTVIEYEKTVNSMDEALEYTMNSNEFLLE